MTRILIAATMAASLFATNLLAAETASPLAPGHAAGVKKAQDFDMTPWWYLLGAGAIIGLAAASVSQKNRTGAVVPATATSTTAT